MALGEGIRARAGGCDPRDAQNGTSVTPASRRRARARNHWTGCSRHRQPRHERRGKRALRQCRESVLVAGYAVYQGQRIFQALADRMQEISSLKVRMFLDIQRGPGDTSAGTELMLRFAERFRSNQWPKNRPLPEVFFDPRSLETDPTQRASLHAKCVVVDERECLCLIGKLH